MKKHYEESYSTCIFLARISFFALLSFDPDNENEKQLWKKVNKIIEKANLFNTKNMGFLGQRVGDHNGDRFTGIAVSLGLTEFNPLFDIYGFYTMHCANPKGVYQQWCRAFDGQLDSDEIDMIINASHRIDDEWDINGAKDWCRMKKQDKWSWKSEIRSIYYFWKKKLFGIDYDTVS